MAVLFFVLLAICSGLTDYAVPYSKHVHGSPLGMLRRRTVTNYRLTRGRASFPRKWTCYIGTWSYYAAPIHGGHEGITFIGDVTAEDAAIRTFRFVTSTSIEQSNLYIKGHQSTKDDFSNLTERPLQSLIPLNLGPPTTRNPGGLANLVFMHPDTYFVICHDLSTYEELETDELYSAFYLHNQRRRSAVVAFANLSSKAPEMVPIVAMQEYKYGLHTLDTDLRLDSFSCRTRSHWWTRTNEHDASSMKHT